MYYNGEDIRKRRLEIRDNIAKSLGIEGGYDEIEKARNVGDMHPNGKWVWKEYKPGKFDWRTAKKGDIAAAGLNKPKSPREAKMKSLAEEYCKRFDLRLEEMIPAGFLARQATDSKNAEGKSRKKYSYAWFFVDTASGDVSQAAPSERTLGQLKKKLKAADDKVKAKIDAELSNNKNMYYNGEDVLKKRLEIRDNIAKSLGVEGGYDEIEKARNVGDMHPNGKWVWTEYKPGKFDWRVAKKSDKASKQKKYGDMNVEETKEPEKKEKGSEKAPEGVSQQSYDSITKKARAIQLEYTLNIDGKDVRVGRTIETSGGQRTPVYQIHGMEKKYWDLDKMIYDYRKNNDAGKGKSVNNYLSSPKFDLSEDQKKEKGSEKAPEGVSQQSYDSITKKARAIQLEYTLNIDGKDVRVGRTIETSGGQRTPVYQIHGMEKKYWDLDKMIYDYRKNNDAGKGKSVNNYLSSPKFDLSEDQKKVASHLNEKLKSFMGMNESNVSLKDIQEAMGWNKNKTHDIVGALVSKEVLVEKIVPSMDGNDYKTYHFKDQENMTYKPTDKKDKN